MTTNYAQHFTPNQTPQTEKADPRQVPNSGGGFAFQVDKWKRLERFLILGAEGGSYYATERKLTRENAKSIMECLAEDAGRTVATIVAVSEAGRAPKNDPAIFALALAATEPKAMPFLRDALPKVCRIGTHLFQFVTAVQEFRGWGPALCKAVAGWYEGMEPGKLAYQVTKYQQRGGISHRDVLRLSHPKKLDRQQGAVLRWVVGGVDALAYRTVKRNHGNRDYPALELPAFLAAFEELKKASTAQQACKLIRDNGFTHEMVPGEWKAERSVWEALSEKMPIGALVRNLGKLTSLDIIAPFSGQTNSLAERLTDVGAIKAARMHPIAFLSALRVYTQGHGDKGKLTWKPHAQIIDALDSAFYEAFQTIEPTGKNTMIAVDCSGSMTWDENKAQGLSLTAREISAAMAMAVVRSEPNHVIVGYASTLVPLPISPKQRLDDVVALINRQPASATDCALPMRFATEAKLPVDVFVSWTDNETNTGPVHPHQALAQYRRESGRNAHLAVAAVSVTEFSIADRNDPRQMDLVGFDSATPAVLADFVRG